MILVLGNNPRRVQINDLDDYVYYKQKKLFSESEYARSRDLQREIKNGNLTILKRSKEKDANFDIIAPVEQPLQTTNTEQKIPQVEQLRILLEKILQLENVIADLSKKTDSSVSHDTVKKSNENLDNSDIKILSDRIASLEKNISDISGKDQTPQDMSAITGAIERLEKKLETQSAGDALLGKLEGMLNKVGTIGTTFVHEDKKPVRVEDIYVPSVNVEDANSHIHLKTRVIEKSDDLMDSANKLKELRKKQK